MLPPSAEPYELHFTDDNLGCVEADGRSTWVSSFLIVMCYKDVDDNHVLLKDKDDAENQPVNLAHLQLRHDPCKARIGSEGGLSANLVGWEYCWRFGSANARQVSLAAPRNKTWSFCAIEDQDGICTRSFN